MSRYQALQDRLSAIEAQLPVRPARKAPPRRQAAPRHDTADQVSPVLQQLLAEVLPGALVLDWRHDGGSHAGRMAAEGLVYSFRVDATGISYRPAWEGVGERGWQLRSDSFLELRAPAARARQPAQGKRRQPRLDEQHAAPRSAVGRGHHRRLQRLAARHDSTAPVGTALPLMEPLMDPELKAAANLHRAEALLQSPSIACFLRTGKLPQHAIHSPSTAPGTLRAMAPQEIAVDPLRFQFKVGANQSTGVVKKLPAGGEWDPERAGVLSVWKDPATGTIYVVNGHHRLEMAKRSGAAQVFVRLLNTSDPLEARAIGALQNIASGTSSAEDADAFFGSSWAVSPVELKLMGLEFNMPQRTDAAPLTLEQRIDALRRKCQTGYSCGSACISLRKECRSAPRSSTGKERMKKLLALAAGGSAGQRGIAPVRATEAGKLAGGIAQRRGQQAAQLRAARSQGPGTTEPKLTPREQRLLTLAVENLPGAASLPTTAVSAPKPGSLAGALKQSIEAMKAADARQFGMLAQQLFESSWTLERSSRYRGQTKEQAMEAFKRDLAGKMQQGMAQRAAERAAAPRPASTGRPQSISEALKATTDLMKASDKRLEQLTSDVIDLRAQTAGMGTDESPAQRRVGGKRRGNRPRLP